MSEIVEDEFAEFSEPVESVYHHPNPDILNEKPEDVPTFVYSEPNMFLIVFIFTLTLVHFYSSQWINFIVSQFSTSSPEETDLKNEIMETKKELETLSQVDEFAKYSKTERKINQLRQKLEAISKDQSMAKMQAKAAFHTMWRILSTLCALVLMWNFSTSPVLSFTKTQWFYPFDWFIRFPTGVPGAVGIPFFTFMLRTSFTALH